MKPFCPACQQFVGGAYEPANRGPSRHFDSALSELSHHPTGRRVLVPAGSSLHTPHWLPLNWEPFQELCGSRHRNQGFSVVPGYFIGPRLLLWEAVLSDVAVRR